MILDNPDEPMSRVLEGDEEAIKGVGKQLLLIANNTSISSFYSNYVPGVPQSKMILFIRYKKSIGYFLYYQDGKIFFKTLSNTKDIFTPNVIDIATLSPISTEDAEQRITM